MSPIPCVGLSVSMYVCPESVLWQIGWLDPDAVWVVSGVGRGMAVLDGVVFVEGEGAKAVLG